MAEKKPEARNIGLNVTPPSETCTDKNCPYHGTLPVRGQTVVGTVVSKKMQDTIIVKREIQHFVPKYQRYMKKTSTYHAHCPPCIKLNAGDNIRIAECRPLSKTVSFVAIEKLP